VQANDARLLIAIAVTTLLAGLGVLVFLGGLLAEVAVIVLLGLCGIALVALVFLLIGRGEERDRRRHPRG
jgi:hypothetical protein